LNNSIRSLLAAGSQAGGPVRCPAEELRG